MTESSSPRKFDLDVRTFRFAQNVRAFIRALESKTVEPEDKKQVIRSSGSVGANFIEVKESLSRKDFYMRLKICRKEAEETSYWLRLMGSCLEGPEKETINSLIQEASELGKIFGSILHKNS